MRGIDSSLAVRARGRRRDAESRRGGKARRKNGGTDRNCRGWFFILILASINPSAHPPASQSVRSVGHGVTGEAASRNTSPKGARCFKQDGWCPVLSEEQDAAPAFVTPQAEHRHSTQSVENRLSTAPRPL